MSVMVKHPAKEKLNLLREEMAVGPLRYLVGQKGQHGPRFSDVIEFLCDFYVSHEED